MKDRNATGAMMNRLGRELLEVTLLMDRHKVGGGVARALFAADKAYDNVLEDEGIARIAVSIDDERTHDSTSAINDEDATPLPRGEGADAPQSVQGDGEMALPYTEQVFNQLVAANTAMETEISSLNERLADKDSRLEDLREQIKDYRGQYEGHDKRWNDLNKQLQGAQQKLEKETREHDHTRSLLATEQRRTERAKGYIDRVLDDSSAYEGPKSETVPVPPAPVGPRLGDILDPMPPRRAQDSDAYFSQAAMIGEAIHSRTPRRAY